MRVDLVTAFVLHTRNFTDSRILVELFSDEYGRMSVVARSSKKGGRFSLLRPFQPLLVSWQGKSELKTLVHSEGGGRPLAIAGDNLYCGMYLNELLVRLLAPADPHQDLFLAYRHAIGELAQGGATEPILRNFELDLLVELGYGIPFTDTGSGEPIVTDASYVFAPANGFTRVPLGPSAFRSTPEGRKHIFRGGVIIAMCQREFAEPEVRLAAKHICRLALEPLLGNKPLKSRELFIN